VAIAIVYSLLQGLQADVFFVLRFEAEDSLVLSIEVYRKIVHEAYRLNSIFILIFDEFIFKIFEVTAKERVNKDQLFVIFRQSIAKQISAAQDQLLFHQ
jgi:DNA-binding LytR/AlgR family response regulator